jgi:hypothetical protein
LRASAADGGASRLSGEAIRSASAPTAESSASSDEGSPVPPLTPPKFFRRSVAALVGRNISQ